jgi:predicted RNA polymerase sigma factor
MLTPQNIKEIIARKGAEEQLDAIDELMTSASTDKERALLLAEKGKILWRLNRRGDAMSAYEQGAQLDAEGPAALLLAHSQSIMDFFNPDLLNP